MTRDMVSVSPDTPLEEVARILARHRLTGISVVDENRRLVGFVSESDIMKTLVRVQDRGAGLFVKSFLSFATDIHDIASSPVRDHMKTDVTQVTEEDDLMVLAELMLGRGHKVIPVTRDSRLVGFVNRAYLCAALMEDVHEGRGDHI